MNTLISPAIFQVFGLANTDLLWVIPSFITLQAYNKEEEKKRESATQRPQNVPLAQQLTLIALKLKNPNQPETKTQISIGNRNQHNQVILRTMLRFEV